MRYIFLSFCMVFLFSGAFAQNLDPVSWGAELVKVSDSDYELQLTANTTGKWIIYSQKIDEGGPIATRFQVDAPDGVMLDGEFQEPENGITVDDEMFGMRLTKFKGPATFKQRITSEEDLKRITGSIVFMTCNDAKCLPPKEVNFTASIK